MLSGSEPLVGWTGAILLQLQESHLHSSGAACRGRSDPAAAEAALEAEAEEYAERKMLEGKDLVFDDRPVSALAPAVRPCRGCAGARLRPPDGALCATTALLFHSADSEAPCREFLAKLDRADPRGGPRFSVWDEPDPAVLGDVFCSVDMLRELYAERYQRGLRRPAPDAPQGCVSIARRVPHCAVGPAGGGRARGCWARSGGGQRRRLVEWR